MKLFYRALGQGPPLIILHGLYGSSDNWLTIAGKLKKYYHIYLIDQRNHGQSPHHPIHDYPSMCEDLDEFMQDQRLDKAILLGHSMGGKTALFFAACHPEKVMALIVADISPRTYEIGEGSGTSFQVHQKMMETMLHLDLDALRSRDEALKALEPSIPSERVRHFLLKNLTRDKNNRFKWKINLPVLYQQLPNILAGLDRDPRFQDIQLISFPVLFLKGGNSNYISDPDLPVIKKFFPYAEIETIPGTGHWLHAEQPDLFVKIILEFLE